MKNKKRTELAVLVEKSGLEDTERQSLVERFDAYESIAQEWKVKAEKIVVENRTQTIEMAMAKEARKQFSKLRIDVEKARKSMKEQSLRKGQAIDSIARYLVSLISPIEKHLKEQEDFIKLDDARIVREKLEEEERKAEKERIAREKAEEAERIRIQKENIRLKKEAEKAEKKERAAKIAAEKKEAEIKKEREAVAEKLRLQREKAEEKERKLREEQQLKLKAEREKAEKAERELREKKEAEEKAKAEAETKKQKEIEEKAKAEKNAAYQKWQRDNNFNPSTMKIEQVGDEFIMWECISKITIK